MSSRAWSPLMAVVCLTATAAVSAGDDRDKPKADPADAVAMLFKDADLVFTAEVGKVNPLGQTNSIPASVFGDVTFKEAKAMKGTLPDATKFSYSYREGATANLDLEAKGRVLVAVRKAGVTAIIPATDANLALAKKAAEAAKEK